MKVCPKCNQTYEDPGLNFCLSDGELLLETETQDAPPTIMMDNARVTNEGNWGTGFDPGFQQPNPQDQQNQQIYQQPFNSPQYNVQTASKDQTLPTVSIISGALSVILSLCCYLGVFIGPVALVTGFIGMKNANNSPDIYAGKQMAIIGMVAGGIGIAVSLLMFVFFVLASLMG